MIPARRSPDGFVALRFPESFNGRGHWLVARTVPRGFEVEAFDDLEVADWPELPNGHGVLLRGETWERPPVETDGAMWARRCPHCFYMRCSATGPGIDGSHLCHRGGAYYIIHWRAD